MARYQNLINKLGHNVMHVNCWNPVCSHYYYEISIHTNIGPAGVRAPVISKSDFLAV